MRTSTLSATALIGLVAALATANVFVSFPADAEDPGDPAPEAIPLELALTGSRLGAPVQVAGLQAMVVVDEQPEIHLVNTSDVPVTADLRALARHESGNPMGRMGPMTVAFAPEVLLVELDPGEGVAWRLDVSDGSPTFALDSERAPQARPGKKARTRTLVPDEIERVFTALEPAEPTEPPQPADGSQVEAIPVNSLELNVRSARSMPARGRIVPLGSFSTWSVELTADGGNGQPTLLLAAG